MITLAWTIIAIIGAVVLGIIALVILGAGLILLAVSLPCGGGS